MQILPRSKPIAISPFAFKVRTLRSRLAAAWAWLPEWVQIWATALGIGIWLWIALVIL